jgi:dTDP-4-amino-4,6-dideoxygalactose transaminase
MKVPFLDLKAQYATIADEIHEAIRQVCEKTAFAGGPFVQRFEEEFAAYCGTAHCVGVGSGTEALWLSLLGLGVGPGDEVITVPNTFIATAEAISFCGAKPVFVDVDPVTYNMNPDLIESSITPRTKAVVPVHLFGQTADMDPILEVAKKHKLHVLEDACQAHGATYKGQRAGSIGDAGAFSFYPGKNLGAYGEGGAVTTNDPELAQRIRMLRDHGQAKKYFHGLIGWNGRMDGIQGAVLSVKLRHLDAWNEARRGHAAGYTGMLAEVPGIVLPQEAPERIHVYHLYPVRVKDRDGLIAALYVQDIHCGIHYPVPLHLQEACRSLGLEKGAYPVAEQVAAELVSLPMFPEMTEEQIGRVVGQVKAFITASVT